MKKITELSEQEILALSQDEIDKMIKFRMAEEGVKFVEYPKKPIYNDVPKPTTKAYYCHLFGPKLSFTDMSELTSLIEAFSKCKTACSIDNNYELPDGYKNYMKGKLENASWSNEPSDTITPLTTYTHQEYLSIKEQLAENSKLKKDYESRVKEYEAAVSDAKWIRDEVMGRVDEVITKYNKLDTYVYRFKNEYLPLSDGNEEIAMNFLNKAYILTDEQKEYILANYKAV